MKSLSLENYIIKIGQNAHDNWDMLDQAKPSDIFFHLSSFPSCYVILEYTQNEDSSPIIDHVYDPHMLNTCAKLCKENTKYKLLSNIKVSYCKISNVYKGDVPGEVVYKSNRQVKYLTV